MTKTLIISCAILVIICVFTLVWVNRYETMTYTIGKFEVYVKENKITGKRCTLREGIMGQRKREKERIAQNFPDWC